MIISGNKAVVGTPLAEIFSVSIKPYNDRCEVYGLIVVKDELGDSYLYNRGAEDAQSIQKHGAISLCAPDHVTSAAADFTVEMDLKDKNGDNEFIKGSFTWDAEKSSSYDTFLSHDFEGKLGKATMYFTVLSVAVDVTFDVFFDKGCGSSGADVYGRIVAYYGKNIGYLVSEESQFVVFDRACDEAVTLKDGDKFPLSRDCLTVPAYSSLVFEADLRYRNSSVPEERIVNGKVEFPARYIDFDKKPIEKQGGLINVYLEWKLANDVEGSPSLGMSRTENYYCWGYEILEIFSACVVHRTNVEGDVEFYGSLCTADGHNNNMALYHYRENDPKRILPDGTLALAGPFCVVRGEYFCLSFSLRNRDLEICNGYWGLTPHDDWQWNNSRMSAVVEGKNGYGIFHFAIFENAVQANVEVTLYGGGKTTIHGSLVAYYGNYEYKSAFVKKYYQTRLLDIPEEEPIEVEVKPETAIEGTKLPLSRYVVAVPGNSSLIIEANLICSTSIGSSHPSTRLVNRSATFSPKRYGVSCQRIEDKNVVADVKISWSGGRLSIPSTDFKRPSESELAEASIEKKNKVD